MRNQQQRTNDGCANSVPDPLFWPTNYTIVQTPTRNYSASHTDMSAIFTAIGASDALSIFHVNSRANPVDVCCVCRYFWYFRDELFFVLDW
jgi:hypothetical protein